MSITLRSTKGTALTYNEADENWDFLARTKHDKLDEEFAGFYLNPQIVVDDDGQIVSIAEGEESGVLEPGTYTFPTITVDETGIISDIESQTATDVSAGIYGNATNIPVITVNSQGKITSITTQTVTDVAEVVESIVPAGVIVMWYGTAETVPSGWALCDGNNGTPDLRDRFVVGLGTNYSLNDTGGSTDAIVPFHNHNATSTSTATVDDPGHKHTHPVIDDWDGDSPDIRANNGGNNTSTVNNVDTSTAFTGIEVSVSTNTTIETVGQAVGGANLPPYYALAYIMKVAA